MKMPAAKPARAARSGAVTRKKTVKVQHSGPQLTVRAHAVLKCPKAIAPSKPAEAGGMPILSPAGDALVAKSRAALEKRGFRIVGEGAASLTIEADPKVFQSVFKAPVIRIRVAKGKQGAPSRARFSSKPEMPEDLNALIETVTFPAPVLLHRFR